MKKILLFSFSMMLVSAAIVFTTNYAFTNSTGAPAGRAGNPTAGGATCNTGGCHSETVSTSTNVLIAVTQSSTPVTSYTPGVTYDVVVSQTTGTSSQNGFECAIESASGFAGTLIAGSGNHLVGSSHYVTHSNTGNTSWAFQWTAPAAGTGTCTIYAVIRNDGIAIRKNTMALTENSTPAGVASTGANIFNVSFANPVVNDLMLNVTTTKSEVAHISIFNLQGQQIFTHNQYCNSGSNAISIPAPFTAGTYLLNVQTATETITKKVVIE